MTNNILLVTGVSGCGKDYVLENAKRYDERLGKYIPILSMGSAIIAKMNQFRSEEDKVSRDKLKHLVSNDVMRRVIRSVIADLGEYPAAVLNGHITYRQQGVLVSNPDIDIEVNPAGYAVVVADPVNIIEWRRLGIGRNREVETLDQIAHHQDFTIQSAEKMASILGVGCNIIENVPANTDESSQVLATMVAKICPK